jgi:hypothetical protein
MGEIKSTLDLVMERTRHLTLSDDEKRRQRLEEGGRRMAGLVQQYADSVLTAVQVSDAARKLGVEFGFDASADLIKAAVERIDLDGENGPWLEILRVSGKEVLLAGVETLISDYLRASEDLNAAHGEAASLRLLADGIDGTAVSPNPEADPEWREAAERLRLSYASRLTGLISKGAD